MKADQGATIPGNEGQVHGTKNESRINQLWDNVKKLREYFVFLNSVLGRLVVGGPTFGGPISKTT